MSLTGHSRKDFSCDDIETVSTCKHLFFIADVTGDDCDNVGVVFAINAAISAQITCSRRKFL